MSVYVVQGEAPSYHHKTVRARARSRWPVLPSFVRVLACALCRSRTSLFSLDYSCTSRPCLSCKAVTTGQYSKGDTDRSADICSVGEKGGKEKGEGKQTWEVSERKAGMFEGEMVVGAAIPLVKSSDVYSYCTETRVSFPSRITKAATTENVNPSPPPITPSALIPTPGPP